MIREHEALQTISCSPSRLKGFFGGLYGFPILGLFKRDARSLDCSSHMFFFFGLPVLSEGTVGAKASHQTAR